MNSVKFTCNMCGERHDKLLPLSTDLTACHRCGNLVDISSLQSKNRRKNINQNLMNQNMENNDEFNFDEEITGPEMDDDFYNFDRYESHEDYLPSPNQINPRFNRNQSNNNRPFVRVNNNRNRSNSTGGMFSIQIANDNYDRVSAYHRHSNFGYPNMNNRNRNNINIYREIDNIMEDFDLEDELNADLELMSIIGNNNHNVNHEIGLVANLLIPPQKPKLKLKKLKMCKDLYTKNDPGKLEKPTCCICLIPMKIGDDIVLLKCQHLFHFKCLEKWVETKEVCPFCRGKIEFGNIIKKQDKKEDKKIVLKEDKKIEENTNKKTETKPIINKKDKNIIFNNISLFNKKNFKNKK